ncbi:MAG: hypothetical protein HY237_02135 [Acidobacteria bacterium]|nr:hypothetical protein [Acidobacteriota bacterium]
MNYQEAVELLRANSDDEDFRVHSVSTRRLPEEGTPAYNEYFETLPEAQACFDVSVAGDPGEEYIIELIEWCWDSPTGGLHQLGVLKTRRESVQV